jgi:hypothetical protein
VVSATSATATASAGPVVAASVRPMHAPGPVPGELFRLVLNKHDDIVDRKHVASHVARAGQEYWVHAACASSAPGAELKYEVHDGKPGASGAAISTGELLCDRQVTVNSLGTLPAHPIVLTFTGDDIAVTSAYAVIAPAASVTGE